MHNPYPSHVLPTNKGKKYLGSVLADERKVALQRAHTRSSYMKAINTPTSDTFKYECYIEQ